MNLDFASFESPQEPPRSSDKSLWSSRKRQEAIRQPTWSSCQAPRAQRNPNEPPKTFQTPTGATDRGLLASQTQTRPMNLDFASSERPQELPKSSNKSLWNSRTRQQAIRQPTWSLCQAPRKPKDIPTSLQRRYHQGASGGMRGAVRIIMIIRRTEDTEEQGVSDPEHPSLLAS